MIHMKYQALLSFKIKNEYYKILASAAVVIGTLRNATHFIPAMQWFF